jgi:hypothetical protein
MSKNVTGRVLNLINTPLMAISNDQIGRTLKIGSNWTKLAIGMRVGIPGSTTIVGAGFAMGMCNGTTNMFKSATTNNFFGITSSGNATFSSNTFSTAFQVTRRVNVTNTNTAVANAMLGNLDLGGGADGRLHLLVVLLTKAAGNIDFTTIYSNNAVSGVTLISRTDWIHNMEADPMIVPQAGYAITNTAGFALDEATNGILDTVNISWAAATALHIADLGIVVKH